MKALLFISVIFISLILVSCNSNTQEETPEQVESIPTTEPSVNEGNSQIVDKSRLSGEEVSIAVFSKIKSRLPSEYKIEQFNPDTRKTNYIGNGKWEFTVFGAGESRIRLPEEKLEESEISWIIYQKEEVTTFDLHLTAFYYEKSGLCEITSIEKYNVEKNIIKTSERTFEAELTVTLKKYDNWSINHRFQINVRNSGLIPINGIRLKVLYSVPKSLTLEELVYEYTLYPDQSAVLSIIFQDEQNFNYYYPDEYQFFTESGVSIPYTVSLSALGL